MTEEPTAVSEGQDPVIPAPPPDDENPAIIDAHTTFVITMISAALFIGAVFIFVL